MLRIDDNDYREPKLGDGHLDMTRKRTMFVSSAAAYAYAYVYVSIAEDPGPPAPLAPVFLCLCPPFPLANLNPDAPGS